MKNNFHKNDVINTKILETLQQLQSDVKDSQKDFSKFINNEYSMHSRSVQEKLNDKTGKFEFSKSNPLVYVHGNYFDLGENLGKFGWSVEKKK